MDFFQRIDDTIRWIRDSFLALLMIPLLATVVWLWVTLHGFLWFDGVQDKLTKAEQTISQMTAASEKATQDQIRLNADNADLNQRITDHAVDHHEANAAAVGVAIDAYVAERRLRQDGKGCTKQASATTVSGSATLPADSGTPPELVAVSAQDLEQLSKAAVQGHTATGFLIDLANAGLAVPDSRNAP